MLVVTAGLGPRGE